MKKKLLTLFMSIIILAGASVFGVSAKGAEDSGLEELFSALTLNGALEKESTGGDWLAVCMAMSGHTDSLSDYAALASARVKDRLSNTEKLRTAVLCAAFRIEEDFVRKTVEDTELSRATELIWRLILACDLKTDSLIDPLADQLYSLELEGGGFALSGSLADPDVTAMATCALHLAGRDVTPLIDLLSEMQCEDGHFISYGVKNAESAAQVVIALRVCGLDPETDPRFIKNGNSVYSAMLSFKVDGGFSHLLGTRADLHTTSQVSLAILANERRELAMYSFSSLFGVTPSNAGNSSDTANENIHPLDYKPIACSAVLILSLVTLAILALSGRFNAKNAIRVGAFAVFSLLFIIFTTIRTPDQFYSENPDPITPESRTVSICVVGLDGEILIPNTEYAIRDGENHLDLLIRATKYSKLRVDSLGGYVRGIGELYEMDHGGLSGWTVRVNGHLISVGASSLTVSDGDTVEWRYEREANLYE